MRNAVVFAIALLVLGALPMPLALALAPPGGLPASAPNLHVPSWIFGAAWSVVYPALGVATSRIWARRTAPGATESLALFAVAYFVFLAFVPITAAAHDQRVTAMMDVVGLVAGAALTWAYRRVDRGTFPWMVPLVVWLPTTTILKVATLGSVFGGAAP